MLFVGCMVRPAYGISIGIGIGIGIGILLCCIRVVMVMVCQHGIGMITV